MRKVLPVRNTALQKADAVLAALEELRCCFGNIVATAESLGKKMCRSDEASLKAPIQDIIQITKDMEGKLTRFYRACSLLVRDDNWGENVSVIDDEKLPEFSEYVYRKYGVELDEDLVAMIKDLIERERGKLTLGKYRAVR